MEREILAFIENLNGIEKETKTELKQQKIEVGNVVLVAKIIPNGESYNVEICRGNEKGKHFVLNADNVSLYKAYGDSDYKSYNPVVNEKEKGE